MDITSWSNAERVTNDVHLNKTIFLAIKNILSNKFNVTITRITPASTLVGLGLDELDEVELIMELEKLYGIDIPDNAVTLGDITVRQMTNAVDTIAKEAGKIIKPEVKPKFEEQEPVELLEKLKGVRILQEIRRFQLAETVSHVNGIGVLNLGMKDDIFEEVYDKPNTFVNVTTPNITMILDIDFINELLETPIPVEPEKPKPFNKSMFNVPIAARLTKHENHNYEKEIASRNRSIQKLNNIKQLVPINTINVMESELLESKRKKTGQAFKRKMTQLAKINEDLTIMRMILGIENEED